MGDLMMDFVSAAISGISLVYWICLVAGIIMVIMSLIFGGLLDLAFDVDGGPFSGPVLASFMVIFGAAGLTLQHGIGLSPMRSVLGAASIAFVGSAFFYYFGFRFILRQQGGTTYDPSKTAGQIAEVITIIPADGTGEITFDGPGGRVSGPARSTDGTEIGRREVVVVDRYVGGTYLVRRADAPAALAAEKSPPGQ